MPSESSVRPRQTGRRDQVRITFDAGDRSGRELPFVIGVLANLSGDGLNGLPPLRERSFREIHRGNFSRILELQQPTLELHVENQLGDPDDFLFVRLTFSSLDDFRPGRIAARIPELRQLLAARRHKLAARDRRDESVVRSAPDGSLGARSEAARIDAAAPEDFATVDSVIDDGLIDDQAWRWERDVVELDARLEAQLNAILHHPKFQRLEASWRGIDYLIRQTPERDLDDPRERPKVRIMVLNVSWQELSRDLRDQVEFDRTELFRRVYTDHFGMAGGEPIGLLIGDYAIHPHGSDDSSGVEDRETLEAVCQVAAAAFCPFIAGVSPEFFGVDAFTDLRHDANVENVFRRVRTGVAWESFRQSEDSRFVGLSLPNVVLRSPWTGWQDFSEAESALRGAFPFHESTGRSDLEHLLWGNAAWAFGETALRAFLEGGWFSDMTGVEPGRIARGVVSGLPSVCFRTDRPALQPKVPVDLNIDEELGETLAQSGFLPLCRCYGSEFPAFFASPSIQDPKGYFDSTATANAWLSASLETMLCVGRFAHYVKVIARDLLGSLESHEDLEDRLHAWIQQYVIDVPNPTPSQRARHPLSAAQIMVREDRDAMGAFLCQIQLQPHFSLERMVAAIRLRTVLAAPARMSS